MSLRPRVGGSPSWGSSRRLSRQCGLGHGLSEPRCDAAASHLSGMVLLMPCPEPVTARAVWPETLPPGLSLGLDGAPVSLSL